MQISNLKLNQINAKWQKKVLHDEGLKPSGSFSVWGMLNPGYWKLIQSISTLSDSLSEITRLWIPFCSFETRVTTVFHSAPAGIFISATTFPFRSSCLIWMMPPASESTFARIFLSLLLPKSTLLYWIQASGLLRIVFHPSACFRPEIASRLLRPRHCRM